MKIKIEAECGKNTCAIEKGKFCRFFYTRMFGQIPHCSLFGVDLEVIDGWTNRCDTCLDNFKEVQ